MAIIKCKMCGGDIILNEEKTIGTCEFCGTQMTLPRVSDDQRAARFNRGNHFRRQGEFDKALGVYESIVREDDNDAEAHWCCALCRFGIEYVEDPNSFEFLPTCHRASFDSFLEDVDYQAALEHSDGITRRQYQKDAAKIAEVQRGILATSQNEEPFDVFICYKETDDATKERTRDSIDAQEIYYQLTQEGYRVFFSRITLEDKVGTEYEPYIFAALNSAKVMVTIGSKPEYFNAVWVKNEWSRFLAMMRKDRSKLLLPCYKSMDPYDLPEQLSVLQSYDMAKIGFIQDLIRGIKKVLQKDAVKPAAQVVSQPATQTVAQSGGLSTANLLRRGFNFLEERDWSFAEQYFNRVLDMDPENYQAYLGFGLAKEQCQTQESYVQKMSTLYSAEEDEILMACEPETERVESIVKRYSVPGTTRDAFAFDLSYPSRVKSANKNKASTLAALRANNNISRVRQHGDAELKKQVQLMDEQIAAACDRRIADAIHDAEAAKADVLERYQVHLAEQEQLAEARCEEAYQKACRIESNAKNETDFLNAAKAFSELPPYKDSEQRTEQCRLSAKHTVADRETQRIQKVIAEAQEKRKSINAELSSVKGILFLSRRRQLEEEKERIDDQIARLQKTIEDLKY